MTTEDIPAESAEPPPAAGPAAARTTPVEVWFDDDAGPLVRLFSMTRGRVRPSGDGLFDLISLVSTVPRPAPGEPEGPDTGPERTDQALGPEHQAILRLCHDQVLSVAEIGSYTGLPLGVLRVLLGDLHDTGLVEVTQPVRLAELPDERLLRDVISGLRAL